MEIKETLIDYTDDERTNFIVKYNHQLGYDIKEYTTTEILEEEEIVTHHIEAWGYTEEEKEQQKKDSIKSLTCTKRVFALMLKELGVPYSQLKELIASNEDAQLEWELCVELLRENPMLDLMAMQLGITPEQLDALFLYANGELSKDDFELYKKKEVVDEDTTDADTTDNESEIIDGQDSP